jgi:hypothetical protein
MAQLPLNMLLSVNQLWLYLFIIQVLVKFKHALNHSILIDMPSDCKRYVVVLELPVVRRKTLLVGIHVAINLVGSETSVGEASHVNCNEINVFYCIMYPHLSLSSADVVKGD